MMSFIGGWDEYPEVRVDLCRPQCDKGWVRQSSRLFQTLPDSFGLLRTLPDCLLDPRSITQHATAGPWGGWDNRWAKDPPVSWMVPSVLNLKTSKGP